MPLFDTKTLDTDFDGAALLASVLYATPQAKAEARARGIELLARHGRSIEDVKSPSAPMSSERGTVRSVDQSA